VCKHAAAELIHRQRAVVAGSGRRLPGFGIAALRRRQVIGLEVPHAHVHLIPINTMSDCDFRQEKLKLSKVEFEETAKSIAANFR